MALARAALTLVIAQEASRWRPRDWRHLTAAGFADADPALLRDYCEDLPAARSALSPLSAAFDFSPTAFAALPSSCAPLRVSSATTCAVFFACTPIFSAPSLAAAPTALALRLTAADAALICSDTVTPVESDGLSSAYTCAACTDNSSPRIVARIILAMAMLIGYPIRRFASVTQHDRPAGSQAKPQAVADWRPIHLYSPRDLKYNWLREW